MFIIEKNLDMYFDTPTSSWMTSIKNDCNILLKKHNIDMTKIKYSFETIFDIENRITNETRTSQISQINIGGPAAFRHYVNNSKVGILLYAPDIRLQLQPLNTVRCIDLDKIVNPDYIRSVKIDRIIKNVNRKEISYRLCT